MSAPDLIKMTDSGLNVPDQPVVPFIEGDGTGPDIWAASVRVFDAAVEKAYGGSRRIEWREVLAGEKANEQTGSWLPEETLDIFRSHLVGIKGPLTTPVGGGIRSLNVALRQILDLYVCLRPICYFAGVPSPVRHPEKTDMVIFRENTEDIYAGIEFENGSPECAQFKKMFSESFPELFKKFRFPDTAGVGIKPVSREGTARLMRAAVQYAIDNNRKSVTLVHKGNIMKFTEGAFCDWGYETAKNEFGATELDGGPWCTLENPKTGETIVIKDVIADAFLQQILTRPAEYDVIATMNLNGDYISDALAACVGGIGIAPGANINYDTGHAIFEATHGTAPKYAGQDKVNPGSLILSGEMMLRYLGWTEAADLVIAGIGGAIGARTVTYDFERLMDGATLRKCSEFADDIINHMGAGIAVGAESRPVLDPDEIGCAICGGATRAYARKAAYGGEWLIHRCPACGHGAVVNRPTLERLREVYAEVEHHACGAIRPDRLTRSPDARRLAERVGRFTNRRGRVLDVGSGDGGFSFHLARLGFGPLVLIDLDPRAAPAAEVVPRSEFRQCAFEDLTPADGPFTVIVMSQILEHALDPMGWLHRARRLLEPEGVLAVALPNFGGVYRLLGRRDPMLIPPVHLNFFTPRSLRSALETAGFGSISMSSTSRVRVAGHGRGLSPVRVLAGRSWNLASRVLDPTSRGIILNAYAGPVHGGGAMAPPGFGVS